MERPIAAPDLTLTQNTTCKIKIVQVQQPIAAPDLTLTQDTTCKIKIVQVERPIAAPDLTLTLETSKLRSVWSNPFLQLVRHFTNITHKKGMLFYLLKI